MVWCQVEWYLSNRFRLSESRTFQTNVYIYICDNVYTIISIMCQANSSVSENLTVPYRWKLRFALQAALLTFFSIKPVQYQLHSR